MICVLVVSALNSAFTALGFHRYEKKIGENHWPVTGSGRLVRAVKSGQAVRRAARPKNSACGVRARRALNSLWTSAVPAAGQPPSVNRSKIAAGRTEWVSAGVEFHRRGRLVGKSKPPFP